MYTVEINHMDLNQIANSGQCFRWRKINDNTYKIPAFDKELVISQNENLFTLSCDENEWNDIWSDYFDVDTDTGYDEVEKIVMESNDLYLQRAYHYGSGIRILRQDLWEMIISFIISQNNNIPRIKKIIERICSEFNGRFPDYWELSCLDLSSLGLGYRDKYLEDAIQKWFRNLGNKYSREELMKIKGVGNKVAECICLFGLHKLDSFPIDTHIRKIINREYKGELPEWSKNKYAGLLQQYVFYYELNHKE